MAGDEEAGGEEEDLHDFFADGVDDVGEDALEGEAALFDGGDDAAEAGLGEDDAGGGLGDVGGGGDGDADLGLAEGGGVVGAVSAHADGVAVALEGLD